MVLSSTLTMLIRFIFLFFSLFTNSYSLNNVGPITEQVFGPGRFLATYLVSGATGNLLSAMKRCVPSILLYKSYFAERPPLLTNHIFFLIFSASLEYRKSPNPALGASGAVFGVMAGLYVFLARNEWVMGQQGEAYSNAITQTLLINLFMGAVNPMV